MSHQLQWSQQLPDFIWGGHVTSNQIYRPLKFSCKVHALSTPLKHTNLHSYALTLTLPQFVNMLFIYKLYGK